MPKNTEAVTIAIIGMNRIGKVHYQNLRGMSHVRVKYICDLLADQNWTNLYPEVDRIVTDYHKALKDPDVQAILICVPTDLHPQITIEAAQAGKDIFCEKPVGFDNDQIMQAYNIVQETGVKFATGFNRRFDKNFRRIVEHRKNGVLGDEQILKITSRDPEPPSLNYINHSGGIFMDMTIHDFDMARYVTGQEVDSVYVAGGVMIDTQFGKAGDLDTVLTTLVFKNGMLGSIDNSRKAVYGYDQRIELFGSQGMVQADNVANTTTTYSGAQSIESDKPMFFFLERYLEAYRKEIESFLDAVRGKHEVECTFSDGIKAIRLAQAAKESALTKKAVKVKDI